MDTNNDGMVDRAEFAASGGSQTDFNRHDLNGDGVLDANEISIADQTAVALAPIPVPKIDGSEKHSQI